MSQNVKVLLVDDDVSLLQLLSMRLQASDYEVICAESGYEALDILEQTTPAIVLTDLRMDGMDGMALFEKIKKRWPTLPVIILTAHGSIPEAVVATQQGVYSFLTKPIDHKELLQTIEQATQLVGDNSQEDMTSWADHIITRSPKMFEVLEQARLVAKSDVNVLISGPSGSGKELLAQAIHQGSRRHDGPFVPVNCGAIPEDLLESELFGHKKGSFTGATRDHEGLFQSANGGTLFLDEIGDMPMVLQVKLLRVLQEHRVRPVGSTSDEPVDVRVLSATHRDLRTSVQENLFREDLYYRLNVVNLKLPSLDERKEDIPLLVNAFLARIAERQQSEPKHFSPDALEMLVEQHYPGNIRQLANVVEQCYALCTSKVIPTKTVEQAVEPLAGDFPSLSDAKKEFERDYVIRLLKITQGNMAQAAKMARRNRSDFYKIVKRHNINADAFKAEDEDAIK